MIVDQSKRYGPVDSALNEQSVIAYSPYQEVGAEVADPLVLKATLENVDGLAEAPAACIQSIGIEFLQKKRKPLPIAERQLYDDCRRVQSQLRISE